MEMIFKTSCCGVGARWLAAGCELYDMELILLVSLMDLTEWRAVGTGTVTLKGMLAKKLKRWKEEDQAEREEEERRTMMGRR